MGVILVLWLLAAMFLGLFLGLIPFGTAVAPACTYVSVIDPSIQVWATVAGWFSQPAGVMNADCTGGMIWRISCIVFILLALSIAAFTPVLACCLSECCQECCCSNQVYPEENPQQADPGMSQMQRYPSPSRPIGTRQKLSNVRQGQNIGMQPVMGTALAMPPARRSLLQPPILQQPPPIRRSSMPPNLSTAQRQAWGDNEQLQLLNAQQRQQQQQLQDEHALARQSLQDRQGQGVQSQWRSLPPAQQQQLRHMSAPQQPSAQYGERYPASAQPSAPEHDPYDYHTWSVAEAEQYHLAASDMQPGSEMRVFYDTAYAAWYDNMYPNWRSQAKARQ